MFTGSIFLNLQKVLLCMAPNLDDSLGANKSLYLLPVTVKAEKKRNIVDMNITCKMWSYISLRIFWARCMDSRTINGVLLGQQGTLSSKSYAKGCDPTEEKVVQAYR